MAIIDDHVTEYLTQLIPPRSPILQRLEEIGASEGIPNITLAGAALLRMLCKLHSPLSILEIGTAIGYSAIHMAEAAPGAAIVTIEQDEARALRAREHFREAGLDERITLRTGDALQLLPQLTESFDLVFIDAAKGQYLQFLELCLPLCKSGGVIVSDNVLFRGLAAQEAERLDRRHRSLVRKLQTYNETLMNHPELDTVILTVGDGMAVSLKR